MAVYLDHAATSPLRPEVLDVYLQYLQQQGNPSSVHSFGQSTRRSIEEAREAIAKAIDCNRNEVIFTSGGTESDNLAIKGLFWQRRNQDARRNVIVSAYTEHHAVIDPIEWLVAEQGAEVVWVPVDDRGVVDLNWLQAYLSENHEDVALVTLMWANNEVGVITPIEQVTELASVYQIPVHSDAVAAFGHIPVSFAKSGLTALTISGHKIGAPVGVGALILSRNANLVSTSHGGGQERGIRSGTLNFAVAKAFAKAAELAVAELPERADQLAKLRDRAVAGVKALVPDVGFSGEGAARLPDNAHFTFAGCSGDSLLFLLDVAKVAVSNGSACRAGVARASHVLMAMGRSEADASGCVRVTLGLTTTEADIDAFLDALPAAYAAAKRAGLPNG